LAATQVLDGDQECTRVSNRATSRQMWAIRAGEQVFSSNDSRERTGDCKRYFVKYEKPRPATCEIAWQKSDCV